MMNPNPSITVTDVPKPRITLTDVPKPMVIIDPKPQITVTDVAGSKWLALKKAYYCWPGESIRSWEFVTRPTRKGKHDAVVVVPFVKLDNGDTVLIAIKEFRVPINDYEIGFVAGLIDGDEDVITAARRELKEESGLDMLDFIDVTPPLFSSPGMTDENVIMVFCEAVGEWKGQQDDEKIEVLALSLPEIRAILKDPPCAMSQKLWPVLKMMDIQGFVGWQA